VGNEPAHPWHYALRPATAHDAAFIYAVRVAGLRSYVEQVWGWDDATQSARFRATFDPDRYQVIVVEGQDVGALSVEQRPNEVFLGDIEILPEWRGRGLGTAILNELVTKAHQSGLPVTLQVLRGNPAQRLYDRIGFRVVGETITHIQMHAEVPQGREDPEAG
jgi:ribosomal protein S18 acetylase RimI-like enzyme